MNQEFIEALWSPSQEQIVDTQLHKFMQNIEARTGQVFDGYQGLWQWSVDNVGDFWSILWDEMGVIGDKGSRAVIDESDLLAARFFPDAQVNYAENMLQQRDDALAIVFRTERGDDVQISYSDLYSQVSQWQQALKAQGVVAGDRVAGYLPNMPETIIAMLATASLGAIWASASPDFGAQGLIDRFGQIEPSVLVCVDGYYYNGKEIDCLEKVKEIQPALKGLKRTVVVPFINDAPDLSELENAVTSVDFCDTYTAQDIDFKRLPFNHPLFIMFSSGTTGAPKCIVHGHGGVLLQHFKEHKLQSDVRKGDRVFYFTTCGWMMWNWLVSGLGSGATLMLYDGSPFYPDGNILWDYAQDYDCTFFGTSAKYIDALKQGGLKPRESHNLESLRTIASTGSPLVHESFDYVYADIKKDVHLASISGGTDIVSCFMLGNPISPVYRGELQCAGLGMAVAVYGPDEAPVIGEGGELVCLKPFPCMPVKFWNDEDGARYRGAYFEMYDNIWAHGDWVEQTKSDGFIIHGRSDATLNPGGVRIGTAEIYRQVEQVEGIVESIAVGQDFDGDVRVILFVILADGWELDSNLIKDIKTAIRNGASPRHVPAKVIAVDDIPRTKSGKITEIAVRDVIMGRPIKNVEALANPKALKLYEGLDALAS